MGYLVHVPKRDNVALRHDRVRRAYADCSTRDGYLSKISLVTIALESSIPSMLAAGLSVVIVPVHTSIIDSTLLEGGELYLSVRCSSIVVRREKRCLDDNILLMDCNSCYTVLSKT